MSKPRPEIQIAFVLFEACDAQDVVGPYEILHRLPGAQVTFVAHKAGALRSDGGLALCADRSFADAPPPDVVVVPGGPGELSMRADPALHAFLREAEARGSWLVSVCTGALLLGAAGLLRDKRATTHWLALEQLAQFGARVLRERYVIEGRLATSAGVSAGIDMALALVARLASPELAQAIQLGIEYDPQPPFQTGSPERAPSELVARVRAASRFARAADGGSSEPS